MDSKIKILNRKNILALLVLFVFFVATFSFSYKPIAFRVSSSSQVIADQYSLNISTLVGDVGGYSQSVAVDSNGNIIAVGYTSGSLVTKNAFQPIYGGGSWDAFVIKIAPNGTLLFSTFLGGNSSEDVGTVAVDKLGNIYVVGDTQSSNFPIKNAFNSTFDGKNSDVFLTKLDPAGNLLFSTYFGGNNTEYGKGVAIDSAGNAYITGVTQSPNLPMKNAWNSSYAGNIGGLYGDDSFVAEFNSTGQLVYSTYIGGSKDDDANGIAVSSTGTVFITGWTISTNFPVKNGYQSVNGASNDIGFVSEFNSTGTLVYSTLFGGSISTEPSGIAVDSNGDYAFVGQTGSSDFPTLNAFNSTFNANSNLEAFLTEFNSSHDLITSTYLGGNNGDAVAFSVAFDNNESIYLSGSTSTNDFPTLNAIDSTFNGSSDGFISKFNTTGGMLFSTFLGGNNSDFAEGIATDAYQNIYVAGDSLSSDFSLMNPYNSTIQPGNDNAFVTKLSSPQITQPNFSSTTTVATTTITTSTATTSALNSSSTSGSATATSSSSSSSSISSSSSQQSNSSTTKNSSPSTVSISKTTPSFTIIPIFLVLISVGIVSRFRRKT